MNKKVSSKPHKNAELSNIHLIKRWQEMHQCVVKNIYLCLHWEFYDMPFKTGEGVQSPLPLISSHCWKVELCDSPPHSLILAWRRTLLMGYEMKQHATVSRLNYRWLLSADRGPVCQASSASSLCALSHIVPFTVTFPEITKRKKWQTPKCSLVLNEVI